MKRYWSGIFLGLFLVTLVMIMLHRDVGEAILITLLYFMWVAKLIIHSVPQLVTEASDIPEDIKAYFLAGLEFGTAGIPKLGRVHRFLRWLGYKKIGPLDLDSERVVEFIETISE